MGTYLLKVGGIGIQVGCCWFWGFDGVQDIEGGCAVVFDGVWGVEGGWGVVFDGVRVIKGGWTSGKGGLALKLPRAAWVSQKTVKISKTQSTLGSHRSKSTWNSIFKDSQSNFKALPKTPRYTQSSPRASQSDLKAS